MVGKPMCECGVGFVIGVNALSMGFETYFGETHSEVFGVLEPVPSLCR